MDLERLGIAMVLQQNRPQGTDDRLLRADVLRVQPVRNQTVNAGSSQTNACILGDAAGRFEAFHKPMSGIDVAQAANYGHDPLSALVNESAARFVAQLLGDPYREMVPAIVLRSISPGDPGLKGGLGTVAAKAPGHTGDDEPKRQPAVCDPAAFFDALIAQQDRHDANYRWTAGRLGLLDNAYAFAAPDPGRYLAWASVFVQERHNEGRADLTKHELDRLAALDRSGRFWDLLGRMLRPDQADAMRTRVRRMLSGRTLLAPLEF